MLRLLFAALVAAILNGCTAGASAVRSELSGTTLASGWRVFCKDDQFKAERTCTAGTFGDTRHTFKFFQVYFVNGKGPFLLVPHDFPGRSPTIRVDAGPVLDKPADMVAAMRRGATAYVVFHVWPRGEERMTVSLAGFSEAYDLLKAEAGI